MPLTSSSHVVSSLAGVSQPDSSPELSDPRPSSELSLSVLNSEDWHRWSCAACSLEALRVDARVDSSSVEASLVPCPDEVSGFAEASTGSEIGTKMTLCDKSPRLSEQMTVIDVPGRAGPYEHTPSSLAACRAVQDAEGT